MLVDEIEIRFTAGDGGKGRVAFNRVRLMQGPTGGDGGHGGSIYLEGVADIGALSHFSNKKEIKAENGKDGGKQFTDGHRGEDLVLKVPTGTVVTNLDTAFSADIVRAGERIMVAGGGVGGRGNYKFRSSTNTSPKEFEYGTKGDSALYRLELRLIADVGLIGLPNAGKSSLLNELTKAHSKVGNYPFTTLEPHLGSYYGTIIADIPGIIEGASAGKGLGSKFLKHIERTGVFFHLISSESDDAARDYMIVRREIESFEPALKNKEELVFITKSDAVPREALSARLHELVEIGVSALPISILELESMERVKHSLNALKK